MAELAGDPLPPAPCGCPRRSVRTTITAHTRACSDNQAAERIAADLDRSVDGCECDECAPPCTQPGCCGNPAALSGGTPEPTDG